MVPDRQRRSRLGYQLRRVSARLGRRHPTALRTGNNVVCSSSPRSSDGANSNQQIISLHRVLAGNRLFKRALDTNWFLASWELHPFYLLNDFTILKKIKEQIRIPKIRNDNKKKHDRVRLLFLQIRNKRLSMRENYKMCYVFQVCYV